MSDKKFIRAEKIEMSQLFSEDGAIIPFTYLKVEDDEAPWASLTVGQSVTVSGTAKGKGFAGVVKRHHFKGGPATHGQSDRERHPGSIGGTTTPGRVYKGKRMAGRLGGQQVTVKGLKIVDINEGKKLVGISGAIPGSRHARVKILLV